ncbi:hypothetical protein APE_1209c.1 [Aeropyrum pernix K1]|uniref:Antitoxin n=1 Tax=Aeropyrum pernix (strain ATCC 700893 / DSM 11879 / JCM 9820 / NBRC 100138 / K1) TaxID=272557 RepID=Q9YCQ1_AERPE|nr:antitoxin family protein [Aeropyrum pernix]BAA80196.2 hypothetical protein APE_1209c.1 [Aeropyrum pernix K1]
MSKVIRVKYEGGVLKPLEPLVLSEGEEVEVVIRRRVFGEEDYRELVDFLSELPKGKAELLDLVEELYLEEALR